MRDRPQRALSARGTRRNWLTIDRRSSRPDSAHVSAHVGGSDRDEGVAEVAGRRSVWLSASIVTMRLLRAYRERISLCPSLFEPRSGAGRDRRR